MRRAAQPRPAHKLAVGRALIGIVLLALGLWADLAGSLLVGVGSAAIAQAPSRAEDPTGYGLPQPPVGPRQSENV
jgi:hypothetical protein